MCMKCASYQIELDCAVCGEAGLGTMEAAGSLWGGGKVVHANPQICRNALERKNKILDEAIEALA